MALVCCAYFSLVSARYAFGDDFMLLLADVDPYQVYLSDGRPGYALADYLVHRHVSSLSQLVYLRAVACLSVAGLGVFFFELTRPLGTSDWERAGFVVRDNAHTDSDNVRHRVLVGAVVVVLIMASQSRSINYWILPHETAFRFMLASLREGVNDQIQRIHVIRQQRNEGFEGTLFIESFASPATEREWMVQAYTKQALRELGLDQQEIEVTHDVFARTDQELDDGTLVIDMSRLKNFRMP